MLLNQILIIIKKRIVDIPLVAKYIKENRSQQEALSLYNKTVSRYSFGRSKLTEYEFNEVWRYLK